MPGRRRITFAAVFASALLIVGSIGLVATPAFADSAPVDPATTPPTVTSDALPTVQVNGVVWQQVVIGNTVYAAGSFSTARPAGSAAGANTVTRNNILAYNLTTGALITTFAPSLNGEAFSIAASPDGSRLYVGGSFTAVNGAAVWRVAALNPGTGALVTSFLPKPAAAVRSIVATASTVYLGGQFTSVGTGQRNRVAAVNASDGALLPWAPSVDSGRVNAMVLSPDGTQLVVGGSFVTVNGSSNPGYGLASLSTASGALLPFDINSTVRDGGANAAIESLASDGDSIYGSGYVFGDGGNLEGAFRASWSGGTRTWIEDCHGDTYDVAPIGDVVYAVGHAHYCGNVGGYPQTDPWTFHRGIAFSKAATGTVTADPLGYPNWAGNPSPTLLNWFPDLNTGTYTGQNQGPWTVTGNSSYVVMGGEFTVVNGVAQQGLVRFAVPAIAPNKDGPRVTGANLVPTLSSTVNGEVRLTWPANWDRDNTSLRYDVIRDGITASPIYTTTQQSTFWQRPSMGYIDKGLVPGQSYRYRLFVTDPFGNVARSDTVTIVATATGSTPNAYTNAVAASNPSAYYRLGDSGGSTVMDSVGFSDATVTGTPTFGDTGMMSGDSNTAIGFSGDDGLTKPELMAGPNTFTLEAWIKTTTTTGGKIIGFGSTASGNSSSYDRHVYMDNAGHIDFGVWTGGASLIASPKTYNDGQWHQIAASMGPAGLRLMIDGRLIGSNSAVTAGQDYTGYWRIGGDNIGGWPNQPTASSFTGDIDEVSIYTTQLSVDDVINHWVASGRASTVPPAPADSYGAAVYSLDPTLFWRLGETNGSTASDAGKIGNDGVYTGNVTKGAAGALSGVSNTAARFAPVNNGGNWTEAGVASAAQFTNPTTYSMEAWFKTNTTSGGKIIGFGTKQTGTSDGYDRHVYMENDGRLSFGTWTGQTNLITTGTAYNDNQWHHVVAEQSSAGLKLYVDGALAGTNPQTGAQDYTGYWRVGGDTTWGGTAPYFTGTIDEVAVYPTALTDAQVANHHLLGVGQITNTPPTASFSSIVTGAHVAFDASASTDPDGAIASYAWDFGDGTTGTGAKPAHDYATPGSYTVTVTVTDNGTPAATAVATNSVTIAPPANVNPTASFTSTVTGAHVAFDASASADPDGSIATYAWDFGDATTGSGVNPSHDYATAGAKSVKLTVTDNVGGTAVKVSSVTIPVNVVPSAAFAATPTNLDVAFDASASADTDGTITGYAWDFGDTTTGTGQKPSHSYAAAGSYTVVLTVTDDRGGTASVSHAVAVTAAGGTPDLARDAFTRTATNGFGTADAGGAWVITGGLTTASANGTVGQLKATAAGKGGSAYVNGVSSTATDAWVTFSVDKLPDGSGTFVSLTPRQVSPNNDYRAKVKIASNGALTLYLSRTLAGAETTIKTVALSGTYVAGQQYTIHAQASGVSPTTVNIKAWPAAAAEPAAWQLTTTDSTAGIQAAGTVGVVYYVATNTTTLPLTYSFDNLLARTIGAGPQPPVNAPPTAAFTATPTDLVVALDASGSTDSDGSVASYAWNYGDGQTGTGATTPHTYTAAGTYTIVLTVTDNLGATATATKSVTVTAAPGNPTPDIARDTFTRTAANGFGAAEVGGNWVITGGASTASANGTTALLTAPTAGKGGSAYLSGVSSSSTDAFATFSLDKLPDGNGTFISLSPRQVSVNNDYRAKLKIAANGALTLYLSRTIAGAETTITSVGIPGTYAAGQKYTIHAQAFGSPTTTLKAKAWLASQTEPTAWQLTTTDTTAALQAPGTIAFVYYMATNTTALPLVIGWDDLIARPVV